MEGEKQLKAAIIMRTWYDAAKLGLNDQERLALYDTICEYSLNGREPETIPASTRIMWHMVKPYLDADKARYMERCTRNRENAKRASRSQSQPVAASRSQSLPVATNTNTSTNTSTSINNNNKTNNNLSTGEGDWVDREKFDIYGVFIGRGSANPVEESKLFWNYYESLGWRNNKGAPIVRKSAAATMWAMKLGTSANIEADRAYYLAFKGAYNCGWRVWAAYRGLRVEDGILHLHINGGAKTAKWYEETCPAQLEALMRSLDCQGLQYVTQ